MSVDINQAVEAALAFVNATYEEEKRHDLAVEEIELSEDGARWLVLVGMGGQERASTMSVVAGEGTPRQYKRIEIDAATGSVLAMRSHNP